MKSYGNVYFFTWESKKLAGIIDIHITRSIHHSPTLSIKFCNFINPNINSKSTLDIYGLSRNIVMIFCYLFCYHLLFFCYFPTVSC